MSAAVVAFAEDHAPAERLAAALGIPHHPIHLHRFPDGEALPTVAAGHETVVFYRSLDRPDAKLMPLLLAADALRRGGAEWIVLVAPYLPYLRQDQVFAPGQPLSRDVLGRLLDVADDHVAVDITITTAHGKVVETSSIYQRRGDVLIGSYSPDLDRAVALANSAGRRLAAAPAEQVGG